MTPRYKHLYISFPAGYAVLPSERPTLVRTRSLPRRKRPVSILKANNKKEQEKNKEELRNLDHVEVSTLQTLLRDRGDLTKRISVFQGDLTKRISVFLTKRMFLRAISLKG